MTPTPTPTTPVAALASLSTDTAAHGATALAPLAAETGSAAPSTLQAAIVTALIAVGGFFLAIGTVGLLRLPDVYNRLHATSKATTLGAASMFLAGFVYFGPAGAGLTSLIGIVFLFLTAPTGAHMISGAAHRMGVSFSGPASWPAVAGESEGESDGAAGERDPDEAS